MKKIYTLIVTLVCITTACETDFVNPNAATETDILSSSEGLMGLAVGLQQRYIRGGASPLYANITASGLTTGELTVLNAGNAEIAQLENGGDNVASANGVIINLWTGLSLTISDAQDLIDNADNIGDPGISAGIEAYGSFFKALALGTMAQYWEQGVINTVKFGNGESAVFSPREQLLSEAISLLSNAVSLAPSVSDNFYTTVGSNINLLNASRALSARYKLSNGDLSGAIADADAVDLTVKSEFVFDNVVQNPVYRTSLVNQNTYETQADGGMGLPASIAVDMANDERHDFYLENDGSTFNATGFFTSDEAPIPVYLPGEMLLIKAEAYARQNDLNNAVTELNKVLTKTAATDIYGVGANLPAYSDNLNQTAVLQEIYRNRAIELYMGGLRLGDSRRLNRPGPSDAGAERNRNFYPYAQTEIDNNPNTPGNPSI
ncbi:MAG: RagB/SusD family nutrient uptake outer membrane protein [Ekhidna sp.]|nr:RagB/SusD family nutrient uptake outer membrane protein [Ekhidna sp.]MBC6427528.1 RagB/SusD family nutrient uptake outer membrane protein [Ekhidna sp.]